MFKTLSRLYCLLFQTQWGAFWYSRTLSLLNRIPVSDWWWKFCHCLWQFNMFNTFLYSTWKKSILELLAHLSKQNRIESMFSNRKDPPFLFFYFIFRGMCTETLWLRRGVHNAFNFLCRTPEKLFGDCLWFNGKKNISGCPSIVIWGYSLWWIMPSACQVTDV